MKGLDLLFAPRSIALVGAAHEESKLGGVILKNLLKFRGRVFPVNPKYDELQGLKTYPDVRAIPAPVDLAVIMRPAQEVPGILRDLEGKAVFAVLMSSGFAEIGEAALQEEVGRAGRDSGIRLLGPNCMGIFNPHRRLDTFFLPAWRLRRPKKGNVAVVSQSGAVLTCLLGAVRASNIGVSKVVGYGNAADIDAPEIYEYLADDPETGVVVSYIESVGSGRRFIGAAKTLSERKGLVVLKSGKGPGGQAAAYSHTGRLAGRYEVFHSLLMQYGISEAADLDELTDAAKALSIGRPAKGRRVCIITNGGGSGVLAADECMRQGLDVAVLGSEERARLGRIFPHFYGINNPLDLTAQVQDSDYGVALRELKKDYDGFVLIALPNVLGITERLADVLRPSLDGIAKPVVFHVAESGITGKLRRSLEKIGIPVYPSPERAVRGLKALFLNG